MLGETEEQRTHHELVDLIKRKGGSITARQLQRAKPKAFTTAKATDDALVSLANSGIGRWHTPDYVGPGAPKPRELHLIDTSTVDTIGRNPEEFGNSVNRQTVDSQAESDAA